MFSNIIITYLFKVIFYNNYDVMVMYSGVGWAGPSLPASKAACTKRTLPQSSSVLCCAFFVKLYSGLPPPYFRLYESSWRGKRCPCSLSATSSSTESFEQMRNWLSFIILDIYCLIVSWTVCFAKKKSFLIHTHAADGMVCKIWKVYW